jgi:hypothetical protein
MKSYFVNESFRFCSLCIADYTLAVTIKSLGNVEFEIDLLKLG